MPRRRARCALAGAIPVTDDGLLRGDGVFEVMRVYGGTPLARDSHLARMAHSARNLLSGE
jgi:branched-chain amino acid aminotransferase